MKIGKIINNPTYNNNTYIQKHCSQKMLKIKSDINEKLLKNFSHESFPDITITTSSSKYSLTLAYLVIDSQFFNELQPDTVQVNLSHLPEKPLVQVLRALYGDQLVVYSVVELELMYRVIRELRIQEYRNAIVEELRKNRELMENLEILEFCVKNELIVSEIKKVHIDHNLRALESNKNFLQLNKISKSTLIPLLLEYHQQAEEQSASVINNILENYFNRNNIRPLDFFEQNQDVDVLLGIWEQFHHILHIEKKMPTGAMGKSGIGMGLGLGQLGGGLENKLAETVMKKSFVENAKTEQDLSKIREKDVRIACLQAQIESQNKTIEKLRKQLFVLKSQGGKLYSTKRVPSNPILPYDEQEQISIIQANKPSTKKQLILKNIKSQQSQVYLPPQAFSSKVEVRTPDRIMINRKPNYTDM